MNYITITILFFASAIVNGQCKKDTSVQYYDSTYQAYSENYQVTVEFGTGSEISNNYNYINYESDALYCVIYGFDKKYEVKLFTNYSSIYNTSCSSINSIFDNGFIKGKDQDGRIWKIKKPSSDYYSNNDYGSRRKYNKPTSSINTEAISNGLSSLQNKIDRNRASIINKVDEITNRRDLLIYEINKLNNPTHLVTMKNQINDNIKVCVENIDTGSNASTLTTISCLNGQLTNLDILEREINSFKPTNNLKTFTIIKTTKKDISYCSISSIRNVNGKTAIEFDYISPYQEDGWINIDPETYLYDATNNRNFRLLSVLGTAFAPERRNVPYNEKVKFILYFEQIPINTKKISIIECENDNCFNFYGVTID